MASELTIQHQTSVSKKVLKFTRDEQNENKLLLLSEHEDSMGEMRSMYFTFSHEELEQLKEFINQTEGGE